ncbi:IclR family transcriptional regulator C-terminal domain-containing protein [Robbsia sp. KACC 23696]|uniref:IclR family transcriptional regulator domain-containing protein n=1 Tax=Robbsia sp. KACC 23696 TaxID=3149231 RepID=UPI00325B134E
MKKSLHIHKRDLISGLQKGLGLLQLFSASVPRMTVPQAALLADMSQSAARRFLLTLVHDGYAETDGRNYWLTAKTLGIAQAYADSAKFPKVVRPVADHVSRVTQEHASVAVRDGNHMVFVARSRNSHVSSATIRVGARVPMYCTASGRLLLATLTQTKLDQYFAEEALTAVTPYTKTGIDEVTAEVRRAGVQGYSIVNEELEIGMRVMGVPLKNRDFKFAGALCLTTHVSHVSEADMISRYLPVLYEAQALLQPILEAEVVDWAVR